MEDKTIKKKLFILSVLFVLSSLGFRLSFVWGTQKYFFSLLVILLPLVGVLFKTKRSVGLVGFYFGIKALFGLFPFTLGLPSLCAAANWSAHTSQSKFAGLKKFLLGVVLPLICMAIFIAHPVGRQAWAYSFYWLIPVSLYFFPNKSVFTISLSSSFIAHAVGSIFWLFLMPISSERWLALIPIVAVERLLFAVAGFVGYLVIKKCMSFSLALSVSMSLKGRFNYLAGVGANKTKM